MKPMPNRELEYFGMQLACALATGNGLHAGEHGFIHLSRGTEPLTALNHNAF